LSVKNNRNSRKRPGDFERAVLVFLSFQMYETSGILRTDSQPPASLKL
jgi:hypothetical protein